MTRFLIALLVVLAHQPSVVFGLPLAADGACSANGDAEACSLLQAHGVEKAQRKHCSRSDLQGIYRLWNSVKGPPTTGGILTHTFCFNIFKREVPLTDELQTRPPTLRDIVDCATINRQTCSAWSILRRDLNPLGAFVIPSLGYAPRISVIIDASKAWGMVSGLGIVDGHTSQRNACSFEGDFTYENYVVRRIPRDGDAGFCMSDAMVDSGMTDKDIAVRVPWDRGSATDPADCSSWGAESGGVERCRFLNSGGCQIQLDWIASSACSDSDNSDFALYQNCANVALAQNQTSAKEQLVYNRIINASFAGRIFELLFSAACAPCSAPFRCMAEAPAQAMQFNKTTQQFQVNVGTNGELWAEEYFSKKEGPSTHGCKFLPSDYESWKGASRSYYQRTLETNGADTTMFANPLVEGAYESEVNLYVEPDATSDAYAIEEQRFFDSVIGWSLDLRTCLEQLSFLNDQRTTAVGPDGNTVTYTNAKERCDGFGVDPEKEAQSIEEAKRAIQRINKQWERKLGRRLPIFSTKFLPDNSVDLNLLEQARNAALDPEAFISCYNG